ncbi:MAG: hypothetical protein KatS3mg050_4072 [Litorilinea sp.]|nr:MAG: hypothetical protein KatS3mg050_4072 [Litorilinea sp.]
MRFLALVLSQFLIFMIPWEGVVEVPGIGTAVKLYGLAVAGFWVITVVITGRMRNPAPYHILVGLFVIWNALSFFWSADPDATLTLVMTWAQLLGLVLILWDLYTTQSAIQMALQAYILGAYVAIGSAIGNYFAGAAYYSHYQRFSPGNTNPDGFGFIVVLGIPVAWYLASTEGTSRLARWLRLVNYLYIPAAFLGLALSGTRTAMIASMPGMAFGLAHLNRIRPWARVAIFLLVVSAILLLLPYVQELRSFQRLGTTGTELTQGDLNYRLVLWRDGLKAFVEHPLLGVGTNMYRSVNRVGKVAHNSFLSVLVEVGLIGFLFFALILFTAFLKALTLPKWDALFWLTVLLVWAIGASTLTWEYRKSTWLFLSLIVANAALAEPASEAVSAPSDTTVEEAAWALPGLGR